MRIGNEASTQFQLDVFGELMDAVLTAARGGLRRPTSRSRDPVGIALMTQLEKVWSEPDDGIWEVRGPRRHFTHSKVMAWVAFDRAVRLAEQGLLDGSLHDGRVAAMARPARHRARRGLREGLERGRRAPSPSTTASTTLDASLLLMCSVGFLPGDDDRLVSHRRSDPARAHRRTDS